MLILDAFCTGFVYAKCAVYLYLMRGDVQKKTLWDVRQEMHCEEVGGMKTLGHFVNRLNLSFSGCSHFYVGNKYMIDDGFNVNLEFESGKSVDIATGKRVFCGCDYKAINPEWHRILYVELKDDSEDIKNAVIEFLKDYTLKSNISVIPMRGSHGRSAEVRIEGVMRCQYEDILEVIHKQQPQQLTFCSFVDHKSNQLKADYRRIYDSINAKADRTRNATPNGKKRTLEPVANGMKGSVSEETTEPPCKKQRTH